MGRPRSEAMRGMLMGRGLATTSCPKTMDVPACLEDSGRNGSGLSMMHCCKGILLGALAICFAFAAYAQSSADQMRVVVTGRGPSPSEAHNDAVRQALQQTVKQLVFADRSVENEKVVRDRVMSTMNGYVEAYRVLKKEFDAKDGLFTQEEEITVSLTRIENFLGIAKGASAELKGGLLSDDATREIAQRNLRGIIFDRLLTGLPSSAFEISFGSPSPDQRDPTQFNFQVSVKLSDRWLNSLRTGLKAIAVDYAQGVSVEKGYGPPTAESVAGRFLKGPVGSSKFCILQRSGVECFLLPPGHYGRTSMIGRQESELNFETPDLLLALRFVDADGKSTISGRAGCLVKRIDGVHGRVLERTWGSGPLGRSYYLYAAPTSGTFTLKAAEVDLASTIKFAAVPLFGAKSFGTYISMHNGNLRRYDDPSMLFVPDMAAGPLSRSAACGELLDDAMLSRRS